MSHETDPVKKLRIFVNQHFLAMKKNKNLAEVIQIELRQPNKIIRAYRNGKFNEYIEIIGAIISEGQNMGVFSHDIKPEIAKRALFGTLDEVSRLWNASMETYYTVDEITDEVLTIYLKGITASSANRNQADLPA